MAAYVLVEVSVTDREKMMPYIENAQLVQHTACLRPVTPDRLPILGYAPNVRGIFLATGAERKGIVHMFDTGIKLAKTDIICAFHADMIAGPDLDVHLLKHLKPK